MRRTKTARALLLGCCLILSGGAASGEGRAAPSYRIKASQVHPPAGLEAGQYQRITRPFENWTLICDENLTEREKVCNVTQTVEDADENLVFSWSLAATQGGDPYLILRTAADADDSKPLSIRFSDWARALRVPFDGCNARVCVAMTSVDPLLQIEIEHGTSPTVEYRTREAGTVTVEPTLQGLSKALAAIE